MKPGRTIFVLLFLLATLAQAQNTPLFAPGAMVPGMRARPLEAQEILPAPLRLEEGTSRWIPEFPDGENILCDPAFPSLRGELLAALREQGHPSALSANATPMRIEVVRESVEGAPTRVAEQAYRLVLRPGLLRISASGEAGAFHAVQTLRQLLPSPGHEMREIVITDWPAFPYRGFMHDTGRNFQEVILLKKQIEILSRYKINVFHFHFTDNPGWRLESKRHPELQSARSFSRHEGKYYTQDEFREIVAFARSKQMLVIPELDVPGHSAAFRRAYGLEKMDAPGVRERLIELVEELCLLVSADQMPYIHLGTDEVKPNERVPIEWLEACVATAHRHGRTVVGWNPGIRLGNKGPLAQQLWTGHSRPWSGRPYFDSQANYYLNHVDPFEMLSAMSFQQPCRWGADDMKLGPIACIWHDDRARNGHDVLLMNHVYPGLLMFSDNAWRGRSSDDPEWWCRLPPKNSPLFARAVDLETRVLAQRDRWFANEPFPYLRQTDLEWRVIGPFDHGGKVAIVFPPESEGIKLGYQINGKTVTWWPEPLRGATHYPRHFWYPSHLKAGSGTIYAFTRVWSPVNQEVGAWIGFNAWSRSSGRSRGGPTPLAGEWNLSHAAVWVNGRLVPAPSWKQPAIGGKESEEIPLLDEDYFYRDPSKIQLREGWNDILVKTPHQREWKWVFTFIPVEATGIGFNVREVEGLHYSAAFSGKAEEDFRSMLATADSAPAADPADGFGAPCRFGNARLGPLREFNSTHGVWSADPGHASFISPRADQSLLKIEGGKARVVQLSLPDVETIDGLSFYLRRWTRNDPFLLDIHAMLDGEWKPIARLSNGDMKGRVEIVKFPVVEAKALRFTLTSPGHGGLMFDQLRLSSRRVP